MEEQAGRIGEGYARSGSSPPGRDEDRRALLLEVYRKHVLPRLVEAEGGCLEWTGTRYHGYGRVRVTGRSVSVHRLAFEALVGSIPPGLTIDHRCKNRACCNVAHLGIETQRRNVQLAFDQPRAERIIELLGEGLTPTEVARMTGVSNNLVSLIAAGKRWANLPRPWSGTLAFSGNSARASEIKRRLDLGESQRSIARACGCSRALVSDIKAGRRWCDLPAGAAA